MKLQVLNLSVKLFLTNPTQTELLCQYIFNLSRYDQNYDIRDRARFLKQFIFPASGKPSILSSNAKKIFLACKPAPQLESKYHGREKYQLGSLSHYLNMRANGYHDIPAFPETAADSSVRNVDSPAAEAGPEENHSKTTHNTLHKTGKKSAAASAGSKKKKASFYSESEKSSSEYSSSSTEKSSSEDEAESGEEVVDIKKVVATTEAKQSSSEATQDSDEDSSDSDGSSSSDEDSSSDDDDDDDDEESSNEKSTFQKAKTLANQIHTNGNNVTVKPPSNLDLLLDLDDIAPTGPIMTPSLGGFLSPGFTNSSGGMTTNRFELASATFIPTGTMELVSKVGGNGLAVHYRFTRAPHIYSATMVSIELSLTNHLPNNLENVRLDTKSTQICAFAPIVQLMAGATIQCSIGIDFNDSTQPICFDITANGFSPVKSSLKPTIGDLVRSIRIAETVYREESRKLRGMNEHSASVPLLANFDRRTLQQRVFENANMSNIPSANGDELCFAGQTFSSKSLLLLTVDLATAGLATLTVNCEKMVIGSMFLNEIKAALRN